MPKKWVIADIHGCFKTFESLLTRISPVSGDTVYFLGDYIDRGKDSKKVIDLIRQLQRTDMNIVPLMGNHEESMIQAILEARSHPKKWFGLFKKSPYTRMAWFNFGGKDTLDSFEVDNPDQIPNDYFEWLNTLRSYAIEEKYLLSHAGFNFSIDNIFDDTDAMRWIRDFTVDLEKTNNKIVIHGHVPVDLELVEQSIKNPRFGFIDLDNGCVYKDRNGMGNLLAFELNTQELVVQPNIDSWDE